MVEKESKDIEPSTVAANNVRNTCFVRHTVLKQQMQKGSMMTECPWLRYFERPPVVFGCVGNNVSVGQN